MCKKCQKQIKHSRTATLFSLPDVLLVMFKRFATVSGQGRKLHSKVILQKQLNMITDEPHSCSLRACALHHGADLYSGHYTALLFEEDNVVEFDDTHFKCVTNNWESLAYTTVYLAIYGKDQLKNCVLEDKISKHIELNLSLANATKLTELKDLPNPNDSSFIKKTNMVLNKILDISMKDIKNVTILYYRYLSDITQKVSKREGRKGFCIF